MQVLSVNVGRPRRVEFRDHLITTAIWKEPVEGPVRMEGVNLDGDDQADRRVHGGPDKAVYAYAIEDYRWWAAHEPGPFEPGTFGENLTTSGIDLRSCHVGDRWHVGSAVVEVAQPRTPCFKLGIRLGDQDFPDRFEAAARPGAYLRIIEPGEVTAGDEIVVTPTEPPLIDLTPLHPDVDDDRLRLLVQDERVPEAWRHMAGRMLAARAR